MRIVKLASLIVLICGIMLLVYGCHSKNNVPLRVANSCLLSLISGTGELENVATFSISFVKDRVVVGYYKLPQDFRTLNDLFFKGSQELQSDDFVRFGTDRQRIGSILIGLNGDSFEYKLYQSRADKKFYIIEIPYADDPGSSLFLFKTIKSIEEWGKD